MYPFRLAWLGGVSRALAKREAWARSPGLGQRPVSVRAPGGAAGERIAGTSYGQGTAPSLTGPWTPLAKDLASFSGEKLGRVPLMRSCTNPFWLKPQTLRLPEAVVPPSLPAQCVSASEPAPNAPKPCAPLPGRAASSEAPGFCSLRPSPARHPAASQHAAHPALLSPSWERRSPGPAGNATGCLRRGKNERERGEGCQV